MSGYASIARPPIPLRRRSGMGMLGNLGFGMFGNPSDGETNASLPPPASGVPGNGGMFGNFAPVGPAPNSFEDAMERIRRGSMVNTMQASEGLPAPPAGADPGWGWNSDPMASQGGASPPVPVPGGIFGKAVKPGPPDPGEIAPAASNGALALGLDPVNVPKPKLFERGGFLGPGGGGRDFLVGMLAGPKLLPYILQNKFREQQYQRERDDMLADREWKTNQPRYFQSGEDYWRYDPKTGQAARVADAPQAGEEYARAMGYNPGTDDYRGALQDYILRASGPTATDNHITMETARQGNREALEGIRQRNRLQLRDTPTWRQSNPLPRRSARPKVSPAGGRGAGGPRPTATGPGGQQMEWNGAQWVPVR